MKIKLENLFLDAKNPRFYDGTSQKNEDEIFQYLYDYESLSTIIDSISEQGFNQMGERLIVLNENGKSIVLEGNRRLCALKYLHGLLSRKPTKQVDDKILQASKNIEVDITDSREKVRSAISMRHIMGVRAWSPEAKRRYYAYHYINGKSLKSIKSLTPDPLNIVSKFIRQYIFLQEFKKLSQQTEISEPSLIYERIYLLLRTMDLIYEIEIKENFSDTKLNISGKHLSHDEFSEFLQYLGKAIVSDGYITSRNINRKGDFSSLMSSNDARVRYPRFVALYQKAKISLNNETQKPTQKKEFVYKGQPLSMNDLILIPKKSSQVSILDNNGVVCPNDISKLNLGKYTVKVDEFEPFHFEVIPVIMPKIEFSSIVVNSITLGNSINVFLFTTIFDIFNEKVDISNPNISLKISNGSLTQKQYLLIENPLCSILEVKYVHDNKPEYSVCQSIEIFAKPSISQQTLPRKGRVYFNYKFFELKFYGSIPESQKIIDELEIVYKYKLYHTFASALRSSMECLLYELYSEIQNANPHSHFLREEGFNFTKMTEAFTEIFDTPSDTTRKSFKKMVENVASKYKWDKNELKNYFMGFLSGGKITSLVATLHLGAHKSLLRISEADLVSIQSGVVSWIEFINTMRDQKYPI